MLSNELTSSAARSIDLDVLDALSDNWEKIFNSKIMTTLR